MPKIDIYGRAIFAMFASLPLHEPKIQSFILDRCVGDKITVSDSVANQLTAMPSIPGTPGGPGGPPPTLC